MCVCVCVCVFVCVCVSCGNADVRKSIEFRGRGIKESVLRVDKSKPIKAGYLRSISETPFKWHFAGRPMVA